MLWYQPLDIAEIEEVSMGPVRSTRCKWGLDGVAFSFDESMSGQINIGGMAAQSGIQTYQDCHTAISFRVRVKTDDLGRFLRDPQHRAAMAGTVAVPSLGGTFEIRDGQFELFSVNSQTGKRQLVYSFHFSTDDGQVYFFRGCKKILHEPRRFDVLEHMTHLFASVYRGMDENAPVYGTGLLRFHLADAPALFASMKCEGASSYRQRLAARVAFLSVAWGALRNEYLKGIRLFYESQYENLVLAGTLENQNAGTGTRFLFVSGVHDKDFPWGDGELFWDVLLAVADGGRYRRYGITDRLLPGLGLDVAAGTYRYQGPIFAVIDGFSASWSRMKSRTDGLAQLHAEIEVEFEPQAGDIVSFPFPRLHPLLRRTASRLIGWLWRALPGTNPPGIHIRSQAVVVRSGTIRILRTSDGEIMETFCMNTAGTSGECEHGTFRSVKRPRMRYRYRCTVNPGQKTARVQIVAGTFQADHRSGKLLDSLVSRIGSAEICHEGKAGMRVAKIKTLRGESSFSEQSQPVLELSNDHYPTAVFLRRIVEAEESGKRFLALEEAASRFRPQEIRLD